MDTQFYETEHTLFSGEYSKFRRSQLHEKVLGLGDIWIPLKGTEIFFGPLLSTDSAAKPLIYSKDVLYNSMFFVKGTTRARWL